MFFHYTAAIFSILFTTFATLFSQTLHQKEITMFDSLTYQKRRKALREKMSNGIILILGNNEAPANYPYFRK